MNEDTCSAARRSFLKALPVVTAGAAVPSLGAQAPGARHHWAMLVDIRRCIGCQACTVSCFMENAVP
ncbi:MAG: tetrathionate reductase subunit B, partial [Rhodocyclaceae bacterium]|nr:tetrathionate reductase subunit B [Rhodocyclaceae bacterium]